MNAQLNLIRASEVVGLPVVTIDGGEDAAEIKDVVYDSTNHRLIGFTLNKRGWFRGSMGSILAAEHVAGIGADAVMVADEACMTAEDHGAPTLATPSDGHDVMGNDVVSSSGVVLGTVIEVILETGSDPQAVGYEVETEDGSVFVPASAQMGLSAENLIVPAEAEAFTNNDLVGFGASVTSFRQMLGGAQ